MQMRSFNERIFVWFLKWRKATNSVRFTLKKLYFSIRRTPFTEGYFHVKMCVYKKKVCENDSTDWRL